MANFLSSISDMISQLSESTYKSSNEHGNPADDLISLNTFYQGYSRCRSNHETSVFVANHVKYLQLQLSNADLTESQKCDILKRCLICKSLGEDVSFAAIHAMRLAHSTKHWCNKLLAHQVTCALLDEKSEMSILMVSTLLRDLLSRHPPSICIALSTATTLVSPELIASLDEAVCEKMKHSMLTVKRRAVACLGVFLCRQPEFIQEKLCILKAALLDKDPGTMAMSLQVYDNLPASYLKSSEDLVKPLLFILNQFINDNLPRSFVRNGVCGPHVMTKLIRVLGKLNHDNVEWKQRIQLSLLSVMDKYERTTSLTAVMVVTECCLILPRILNDNKHLSRISKYAGQLLQSNWSNYKSTGLKIFAELIKYDKSLITSSQGLVISALSSADPTISQKSMSLIIQLTTPANIQSVYELYSKVASTSGGFALKQRQSVKILTSCDLSELNMEWFTEKLVELFTSPSLSEEFTSASSRESSSVTLNNILTYLSADSVADLSKTLFDSLKKQCPQELLCLDILTTMLWLRITHQNKFAECDSEFIASIVSLCQKVKAPAHNILTFLTCIRSLMTLNKLTLKNDEFAAIKQLVKVVDAEDSCHCYLEDIERILSSSVSYSVENGPTISDKFWADVESYTQIELKKNSCRPFSRISDGAVTSLSNSLMKFSIIESEPEVAAVAGGDVLIRSSKTVWTAKGRVNLTEGDGDSGQHTSNPELHDDSESAPVVFDVESEDTTTAELASHIFSSM